VLGRSCQISQRSVEACSSTRISLSSLPCWTGEAVEMNTPRDVRPGVPMGTPSDVPDELGAAEDRTSRVDPASFLELPPLPVETAPGILRLAPKPPTTAMSLNDDRADDLIGKHCGGYVIEALLGEGGMGKVYLANNPRLGKRAAVKVLQSKLSFRSDIVDRFLQEARAAAHIDDPNIIDVLDANELGDGRAYLLMPYVEGVSLEDLCERKGLMTIQDAAPILLQICSGLDAAHQHGIIHRDIKPQNILVGKRRHREHFVRIVDFGIAKLLDPDLARKVETHSMAVMGTLGYMAPEQARGEKKIDSRADVYAVGVVAYRMLTGRRPYMDESLFGLIGNHATNAYFPRLRELRPDLPLEWDEAIMEALANNKAERLTSVRELALRLARGIPEGEQMLRMLAPQLSESPLPPHARTLDPYLDHDIARRSGSQRRQSEQLHHQEAGGAQPRRWLLAVGALSLLLVGGLLGLGLSSRFSPTAIPPGASAPLIAMAPSTSPAPAQPSDASAEVLSSATVPGSPAAASPALPAGSPAALPEAKRPEISSVAPDPAPDPEEERSAAPARAASKERSTPAAKTARTPSSPSSASAASGSRASVGQLPKDDAASLARLGLGVLVVKVQPWGLLTINGAQEGYAPKRKEMPAGRYVIHIATKNSQSEIVEVNVNPGKVTTVERSYP
jgi:serine/threonine protein kinase